MLAPLVGLPDKIYDVRLYLSVRWTIHFFFPAYVRPTHTYIWYMLTLKKKKSVLSEIKMYLGILYFYLLHQAAPPTNHHLSIDPLHSQVQICLILSKTDFVLVISIPVWVISLILWCSNFLICFPPRSLGLYYVNHPFTWLYSRHHSKYRHIFHDL